MIVDRNDYKKTIAARSEPMQKGDTMTDTKLLKEYIKKSGLKVTYIAEQAGLSRSGLWKKISNKSPFNQYEIESLCNVLGIKTLREKERIFFANM